MAALNGDQNSIEVMAPIDALPVAWRHLVHEFGREIVLVMRDEFDDPDMAWMALEARRSRRQDEWLATDYVLSQSARIERAIDRAFGNAA
jgi:hypothetical protein